MKVEKNFIAVILIGLAVAASGCTSGNNNQTVKVEQTKGLQISEFTATPVNVFGGQPVNIRMTLENVGGRKAENIQAKIYNIVIGKGKRAWKGSPEKGNLGSLRAPNPDTNTPSVPKPVTWTFTAPNLDQGVKIPYDFFVRVYYDYETKGTTSIEVMDSSQYRRSGATRSTPKMDNSAAPVQLKVRTRTPIVFYQNSGAPKSELCLIVENKGSGTVTRKGAGLGNINEETIGKVSLKAEVSGSTLNFVKGENDDYSVRRGGRTAVASGKNAVEIIGNQGVKCFSLKASGVGSGIQTTVPITVTANYGYYIEDQTSVTVEGRRG